jgi:membrane protein implicated in regulation of membrane protease activity
VGVLAFFVILEFLLPPLAVIAIIVGAALAGRPRHAGRRAHVIAVVPLALAAVWTHRYFWRGIDHNIGEWVVPPLILGRP